jgi:hypothetical protein
MTNQNFPTGVDEVTPAWLTSVLRSAGGLDSGSVTGFEAELIGQGIGIMGLLHRLRPTYDGGSGPETVILKSPVQDEGTRFVARTFMFYGKEVAFYRTAADDSPLTTPRCFAADHDSENDEFVLLLEDLADAEVASQLDGCPLDLAEASIRALARHHAAFWESPAFDAELSWVPYGWDPPMPQGVQHGVATAWEPFLAAFGDDLGDDIRAIGERFPAAAEEMMSFQAGPTTLCHGDYRLDNLFFRPGNDGPEVTAIDWQICIRTAGAYDVGYFISQSLTIEDRRSHERHLLDLYRTCLADKGIDYPADQLFEDYRRTVLFCLCYPIQSGGSIELVNERAVQLVSGMLDRSITAIRDLDAGELMP